MKTNSKAQGMSINIVIIIVLALLALVLVGYFVISGFGEAGKGVTKTAGDIQIESDGIASGIGGIKSLWSDSFFYCCIKTDSENRIVSKRDRCLSDESKDMWGSNSPGCEATDCTTKCGSDMTSKISGTKCKCYTK